MTLLAILALVGGVFCGSLHLQNVVLDFLTTHEDLILNCLMFSVGISIGLHKAIVQKIRQYHVKIFIIPIGTIIGSLLGGLILSFFTRYGLGENLAIASGLGWYSLSGVTLENLGNATLGSIAFLSNLMRELFSFISIPFVARHFNFYSCIALAGATSEDTTLPMMMKYTNEETVVLSVINGVLCSAVVPVLIPFFMGLGI